MLWRPVMLKKALYWELDTHWSLDDLLIFNELQDIQDDLEQEAYNNSAPK